PTPSLSDSYTLSLHDALPICILKDVAVVKPERLFDVDRAFAFDAKIPVARDGEAIFERFCQPAVHAFDEFLLGTLSHCLIVRGKDRKSTRLNSSHVAISYAVF